MSLKWKLTGLFLVMTGFGLLLFRNGESVLKGYGFTVNPWMTLLALVLPAGWVFFYSYRLTGDMRTLQAHAQRLSRGSFEQVPVLRSGAELGQLGEELNRLSRHIENLIQTAAQETHRLEALLGGMQEGVVALDHVGRVVLLNSAAEEIFFRPFAEVKHKYLVELVQDQELDKLVAEVLQGGAAALIELNIGEYIVRTQVSPILSEDGRAGGAVIVCHDITELRRLEKLRTEFVANVSHELRTPLTSIKGFAETLLDGAAEEPALRERFLKIIQAESLRLQRLVEDLLTLSHIENRGVRRAEGISNVERAYEKIQPVIERYAEAKGISLRVELPPDLPALYIGEDLLSQLMLNLLENAVKYTSGGSVWLKASVGVGEVRLEFGDTGCGIPEGSLPRIFERFFRVDKARSREQGGTGLGLSIVKHIVDGSGGKVTVQSELGKGTVFTCSLPMAL